MHLIKLMREEVNDRYEDIEDGPLLDKVNLQVQEICNFLQSRIEEVKRPSKEIEDMLKLNSTLLEQIKMHY